MDLQRVAGIVIVIGSLLFMLAAFMPPTPQFFSAAEATRKLAIITGARRSWVISQIFFALGAWVAALGTGIAAYGLRNVEDSGLGYAGFAAFVIGASLWSWHVYSRTVDAKAFVEGVLSAWPFLAYTVLMQAGLLLFGLLLLRTPIPHWVGRVLILGASIFLLTYLKFRDLPPAINYVLMLLVGIVLAWRG